MLLKMRGGLDSIFVTLLLGVLIAAFAIWGIGPGILSGVGDEVATVGEREIPADRFARRLRQRVQDIQTRMGGEMDADQIIKTFRLDQQVLRQMIAETAVGEHTRALGMRATDREVAEQLASFDAFTLPDGTLSREMMRQALRGAGMTEKQFIRDLRRSLAQSQLVESMAAASPQPRLLAEKLYRWREERRFATMINMPADAVESVPEPTQDQITAHYESNKQAYRSKEQRSYSYVLLTPERFMDQVTVSAEDLRAAYDVRYDEFVDPELRFVRQVSFDDRDTALSFIDTVRGGADFTDTAASMTAFSEGEIALGDMTRDDLVTDFNKAAADAVFSLESGGVTKPVEGLAGWNVFQVGEITPGSSRSFEEVRDTLVDDVKRERAIDTMFDFLPKLEDAVAMEGDLAKAAEKVGMDVARVDTVTRRGLGPDGDRKLTEPTEFRILAKAWQEMTVDDAPRLFDVDASNAEKGLFMLDLRQVSEPAQKPLEDVRDQVVRDWKRQKRQEKAGRLAETALERLNAGEAAEAIAADMGGTSYEAKAVTRTAREESASLSDTIRRLIYDLGAGEAALERAADGNGYVVVRVDDVQPGDPLASPGKVDQLHQRLQQTFADDLLAQYQTDLLDRYDTEVNQALVNQVVNAQTGSGGAAR